MSDNEINVRSAVEVDINYDTFILSREEGLELINSLAKALGIEIAVNL